MANKAWLKKGADGLTFGERLEDLIKLNKTTATALAKETGIAQSAISDYLNKDRAPDCATVYALARHFSVSTDYLLGLSPIPTTDLTIKEINAKTGLSEEHISQLLNSLTDEHNGLTYSDYVNMCLDVIHMNKANFAMMSNAMTRKLQYEASHSENIKPDDSSEFKESLFKLYAEIGEAQKNAQEIGCYLLSYDDAVSFYARQIASDLECYLRGVFSGGNN